MAVEGPLSRGVRGKRPRLVSRREAKRRRKQGMADNERTAPLDERLFGELEREVTDTEPTPPVGVPVVEDEDLWREYREMQSGEVISFSGCDAQIAVRWEQKTNRGTQRRVESVLSTSGKKEAGRVNQDAVFAVCRKDLLFMMSIDGVSASADPYGAVNAVLDTAKEIFVNDENRDLPGAKMRRIFLMAEQAIPLNRDTGVPDGSACAGAVCIDFPTRIGRLVAVGDSGAIAFGTKDGITTQKGMTMPLNVAGQVAYFGKSSEPFRTYINSEVRAKSSLDGSIIGREMKHRVDKKKGRAKEMMVAREKFSFREGEVLTSITYTDALFEYIGPFRFRELVEQAAGDVLRLQQLLDIEIAEIKEAITNGEHIFVLVEHGKYEPVEPRDDDISYTLTQIQIP